MVTLPLNLCRTKIVTNAVRIMIKLKSRTRRVQLSTFVHQVQFTYFNLIEGLSPTSKCHPRCNGGLYFYLFDRCIMISLGARICKDPKSYIFTCISCAYRTIVSPDSTKLLHSSFLRKRPLYLFQAILRTVISWRNVLKSYPFEGGYILV